MARGFALLNPAGAPSAHRASRGAQDLDYAGEPLRLPTLFPPAGAPGRAPALPAGLPPLLAGANARLLQVWRGVLRDDQALMERALCNTQAQARRPPPRDAPRRGAHCGGRGASQHHRHAHGQAHLRDACRCAGGSRDEARSRSAQRRSSARRSRAAPEAMVRA